MASIMVVDDESEIADLLEVYLSGEGYTVYTYYCTADAKKCIDEKKLDLAILDIMLPDGDGYSLCRYIRREHLYPVIMLTARDGDTDKITGLSLGADDYVTKPFQPLELMARVRAQLRRYTCYNLQSESDGVKRLVYGELTLIPESHTCTLDGKPLSLTPTEFTILRLLCENPGKVISAEELFHGVWGEEYWSKNTNTVTTHIRHLREKMGDTGDRPRYIQTVWGIGYKLGEG